MSNNGDEPQRANTRRRIIEQAQLHCYETRSICHRAKNRYGEVPREIRLDFQEANVDYYWALRPLREESVVKSWWNDHDLAKVDGEELTGLDSILELDGETESVTDVHHTVRGISQTTQTFQRVYPFTVLRDISGVLDDAARKLGFAPDAPLAVETEPEPV